MYISKRKSDYSQSLGEGENGGRDFKELFYTIVGARKFEICMAGYQARNSCNS